MFFRMIYDDYLAAACYLIGCQRTGEAILIDPERDIDRYLSVAKKEGLRITAATETHIHADFLSGCRELAEQTEAHLYLSDEGGADWRYDWVDKRKSGGRYPVTLLKHGSMFNVGNIEFKVVHTPGHTPEHIAFLVTDRGSGANEPIGIASGDFLFVGDMGRPDLLETAAGKVGASDEAASTLFHSARLLQGFPDFLQVWPAHGAGSACGKALGAVPSSTIGYEKRFNPALQSATSEKSFREYILAGQSEPPLYFARMKQQNKSGPAVLGSLPKPSLLSTVAVKEINTEIAAVIDTRSWSAYREGHIPGSFFHPLNKTFVTDVGSLIGENPEIYLICNEAELDALVRCLVRIGLDNVRGWVPPSVISDLTAGGFMLATIKEESSASVKSRIENKSVHVLDVRRGTEYAEAHIENALNIAHTRLATKLSDLPTDKPLLVHCQGGVRSAYACGLLKRAGYDIINLEGGMSAWQKSFDKDPLTRHGE